MINSTKLFPRITSVLVFLVKENQVSLAIETSGFGKYHLNGHGTKCIDGEVDMKDTVYRVLKEKAGIEHKPRQLKMLGIVDFFYPDNDDDTPDDSAFIYIINVHEGEVPQSTKEAMKPRWYNISDIPYHRMMPAAIEFLPKILRGEDVRMMVKYFDQETYQTRPG